MRWEQVSSACRKGAPPRSSTHNHPINHPLRALEPARSGVNRRYRCRAHPQWTPQRSTPRLVVVTRRQALGRLQRSADQLAGTGRPAASPQDRVPPGRPVLGRSGRDGRDPGNPATDRLEDLGPATARPLRPSDADDHSVHPAVIGRIVEVTAGLDQVTATCGGKNVARHDRCWAAHQTLTDDAHAQADRAFRRQRLVGVPAVMTEVEQRKLTDHDRMFGLSDEEVAV
ncbi:Mu transposase domain-containing protein [Nonomuraea sp. bgisy101]|uniref:Mu transposase domain-containing protein n=1 Tax=Nonomuraea sp. bgisy101 TaxID=3413784 RepID=UPI003D72A632